jgi:hypothetical protein
MAAQPQRAHAHTDWPPTSPRLTLTLLNWVIPTLPQGTIWEAGRRRWASAHSLRNTGRKVIATDLKPRGTIFAGDFVQTHLPAPKVVLPTNL